MAHVLSEWAPPQGVTLVTEMSPDLTVYADPGQMRTVLGNLVANAYQAMPEGGTLTVRAQESGDEIALSVTDTGCGISEGHMDRLFEPLFTTKARGIGLGLAISGNLIEANGGRIEVTSQEGEGSTFTMVLPRRDA